MFKLQVYAGYRLRTFLIGCDYDSLEDLYVQDHQYQKKMNAFTQINIKQLKILNAYLQKNKSENKDEIKNDK